MKTLGLILLGLAVSPAWAGYQYYVSDSLGTVNPLAWSSSGQISPGTAGLAASDPNGGSLISRVPIPGGGSDAEVALTLSLKASGGNYTAFLQASADARSGGASAGSYLAFEMQNPVDGHFNFGTAGSIEWSFPKSSLCQLRLHLPPCLTRRLRPASGRRACRPG